MTASGRKLPVVTVDTLHCGNLISCDERSRSAKSSLWLGQRLIISKEKVTLVTIKKFLIASSGTAVGTLLYTNFMSQAQEPDWGRAAFVGVFCGIIAALWPNKK